MTGCNYSRLATTYGDRYTIHNSSAVYADSNGLDIVDRPDLESIIVVSSAKSSFTGQLKKPTEYGKLFKTAAQDYLNLDRTCEITGAEIMLLDTVIEYKYKCKK